MQPPEEPLSSAPRGRQDRLTLKGYGCLLGAMAAGALVALGGMLTGLQAFFSARSVDLGSASEAPAFLGTLESSLAWCALGALGVLVFAIALVLLLKELGDESARRQRGAI